MNTRMSLPGAGSAPERSGGALPAPDAPPDGVRPAPVSTEVPATPRRRQFSASYKLEILEEADRCADDGAIGALLRREGLYSSHLSSWRRARRKGSMAQLSRKRGTKPTTSPETKEVERLRRENARLCRALKKAQTVIDVQKKLSELMGIDLENPESDGND